MMNNTRQTMYTLIVVMLYFALWSVLPFILSTSYPLDVAEGIYWGREWQWGYYKHPPLSSWVLYSFYAVLGSIGPYILSQCCIALTLWLVYRLGVSLWQLNKDGQARAGLAALLTMGMFYYTWPSLEFNHNIAQMPVWVGLVWFFYRAIKWGLWRDWLLFGVLAGAGMLVKYSVAVLLVSMVLYSWISPYRSWWLRPQPWVAILLAILVFAPNVWWLIQHDWLPFQYAESRSAEAGGTHARLKALQYLGTQLLNHLPLFLILLATRTRLRQPQWSTDNVFLWWMGLVPTILLMMAGLIFGVGLRDMWGMPMWGMSGLIVVSTLCNDVWISRAKALRKAILVWMSLITILMVAYLQFGMQLRHKPSRMDWPQVALAQQVDKTWQQLSQCSLDSVGGNRWLATLVAASSNNSPSVWISEGLKYTPWMDKERLQEHGTIVLTQTNTPDNLAWLSQETQGADWVSYSGEWILIWPKLPKAEPLRVHWTAYVPKSCKKDLNQ